MSDSGKSNADRWEELQITRLLFGLSLEEQAEYDELSQTMPAKDADLFEWVVASIDVAWSDPNSMPLPDHLRETIRLRALKELKPHVPQLGDQSTIARDVTLRSSRLPWVIAAASIALTVLTFVSTRPIATVKIASRNEAQLRAELVTTAKDLVQVKWADGPTPIAGAEGDVVWSPSQQQGFMRFRGLAINVPTVEQYQLWIFDKNQSDKTPIDGGVFDITSDQEVIIPIQAKLRVQDAYLFAITIEKPGGVVVSSRERLPLLAAVN
ncbi:anti-sigma factor [Schlesneria paludicola]|uniref:anti-sigma factor n=1 Tax=Schlesneria paludicola TaxID=360056 RepID=UPI000299EBD7|nr:anti-sigma factor [Schlesneria paludicola]